MKVLFICGLFARENESEVAVHARTAVEYSATAFQKKLASGLGKLCGNRLDVISAPFIGSWPNASDIFYFKGFSAPQRDCRYVKFLNAWGLRNFSRAGALKKAVRDFAADGDADKLIVVYSPHAPYMEAAAYAKKKDPRIKICLVVPDLPQYMNLNAHKSLAYRLGKYFDIKKIERLNKSTDSFMLLTDGMKEPMKVGSRRYFVAEGIIDRGEAEAADELRKKYPRPADGCYIVYTGKLYESFGVKTLVEAFMSLEEPDLRLVLCGRGDCEDFIRESAAKDPRIQYKGQVSPEEAREWMYRASVLVNPRPGREEYTKYTFPSKNIEYLLTGNPVAAYMLEGMPKEYEDFIVPIRGDAPAAVASAIETALTDSGTGAAGAFRAYAVENLDSEKIANKLLG